MLFFQVFVVKISLIFSVSRYEKYFPQCFFLHRRPPGISRYFVNTRKKSKFFQVQCTCFFLHRGPPGISRYFVNTRKNQNFFQVPCTCFFLHKIWQYLEIPGTIPGNRCKVAQRCGFCRQKLYDHQGANYTIRSESTTT